MYRWRESAGTLWGLLCLRKPAQRSVRASTVEEGGRERWVRGRAMAAPEERGFFGGAVGEVGFNT
jgi:hypothetical protein